MSRIVCLAMSGILGLVPGVSLGQGFGVPEGTKFQPVITDRMIREAQEGNSENSSGRHRSKYVKPRASPPVPANNPQPKSRPLTRKTEHPSLEHGPTIPASTRSKPALLGWRPTKLLCKRPIEKDHVAADATKQERSATRQDGIPCTEDHGRIRRENSGVAGKA